MLSLNKGFEKVLEPLGEDAPDFFLAASLYHAQHISFEAAAQLARLDFEAFHMRLTEQFGVGFMVADEVVLSDLETVQRLAR